MNEYDFTQYVLTLRFKVFYDSFILAENQTIEQAFSWFSFGAYLRSILDSGAE